MKILGKTYDEKTAMKYSGTMESLNSARRILLMDGKAKGTEAIEVSCSGGLELLILVDRGLDIASAKFKGVNLSFLSKNGITGRCDTNPHETEFLHYFTGGMLTTCGLRNAGPSCREENGEYHPLHGRINSIPASDVSIKWIKPDLLEISGILRETALFGCQLKLHRTITVDASESRVTLQDELLNESAHEEEFMLVYHCNFGFPFIQEGCRIEFEEGEQVIPRTETAKTGMHNYTELQAPDDNYEEQVFFHMQKGDQNGNSHARVINPELSLCAEISQSLDTLPVLVQWKSMRSGDYALGIEPCNNYIKGRVDERRNGTLPKLGAYESRLFKVELKISELE